MIGGHRNQMVLLPFAPGGRRGPGHRNQMVLLPFAPGRRGAG